MSFDPEKVERVQCMAPFENAFKSYSEGGGESVVVKEEDYDELLSWYRTAEAWMKQRMADDEQKAIDNERPDQYLRVNRG